MGGLMGGLAVEMETMVPHTGVHLPFHFFACSPLLSPGLTQADGHRWVPSQLWSPQAEYSQMRALPSLSPFPGRFVGSWGC